MLTNQSLTLKPSKPSWIPGARKPTTSADGLTPLSVQCLPPHHVQSTPFISPPLSPYPDGCIFSTGYPPTGYFNPSLANPAFAPPPSPLPSPPTFISPMAPAMCPSVISNRESGTHNDNQHVSIHPLSVPHPKLSIPVNSSSKQLLPLSSVDSDAALREVLARISTNLFVGKGKYFKFDVGRNMVSFPHINPRQLHTELSLIPAFQLEHFINRTAFSQVSRAYMKYFANMIERALKKSQLAALVPKVHCCGSQTNGLDMYDADLDIFIRFEACSSVDALSSETALKALELIREVLLAKLPIVERITGECGMKIFNSGSHCPIIELDFASCFEYFQPEIDCINACTLDGDPLAMNKCYISLTSMAVVHTSSLFKFFCKLDSRFREMTLLLKYWAKQNELIGPQAFSSYAFTLLIVSFLQQTNPPILPSILHLQELAQKNAKPKPIVINGFHFEFCDDRRLIGGEMNLQTTAQLVVEFFRFCAQFNFDNRALRPRMATDVAKTELYKLKEAQYGGAFGRSHFCIEDPFVLNHNPASVFQEHNVGLWECAVMFALLNITTDNYVTLLTVPAIKCFVPSKRPV